MTGRILDNWVWNDGREEKMGKKAALGSVAKCISRGNSAIIRINPRHLNDLQYTKMTLRRLVA